MRHISVASPSDSVGTDIIQTDEFCGFLQSFHVSYYIVHASALILWRVEPLLDNDRNTYAANTTGVVFSMYADGPLLCNAHAVTSRKIVGGDHMTCVYCDTLSVPRLYK